MNEWFPEIAQFFYQGDNAGCLNIMSYDLSDNMKYFECPDSLTTNCPLDKQVHFYLNEFAKDLPGVCVKVGYEIGTPAFPSIKKYP